jgi:hypothetical protein
VRSWAVRFTRDDETAGVEVKGHGTQWVAAGTHPSGALYKWTGPVPDVFELPILTEDDSQALRLRVIALMEQLGWQVAGSSSGTTQDRHALGGPSLVSNETLGRVLAALPNDGGWDEGVRVLAAVRGVLGRDGASWPDCVLQWVERYTGGNDDPAGWLEARWRSFDDGVSAGVGGFVKILQERGLDELAGEVDREAGAVKARELFDVEEGEVGTAPGEPEGGRGSQGEGIGEPPPPAEPGGLEKAIERIARDFVLHVPTGNWLFVPYRGEGRDTFTLTEKAFNGSMHGVELTNMDLAERRARWDGQGRRPEARAAADIARESMYEAGRAVWGAVYAYGDGSVVDLDLAGKTVRRLNTAILPKWGPRPQGDLEELVRPFVRHMEVLIRDPVERRLVLDWVCWVIRNPTLKVRWAITLIGEQGSGKDTAFAFLVDAIGGGNVFSPSGKMLAEKFTPFLEKKLVLVSETPAGNRIDVYEHLKALITGTGTGKQAVERKGVDAYTALDRTAWVFLTNNENALAIAPDDRRFYVVRTRGKPDEAGQDEMAELNRWREAGGWRAVAWWLSEREISADFSPDRCPAATDAKAEMARAAMPVFARWFFDELTEEGTHWASRTVISLRNLKRWVEANVQQVGPAASHYHDSQAIKALAEAGWFRVPGRINGGGRGNGVKHTVWASSQELSEAGHGVLRARLQREENGQPGIFEVESDDDAAGEDI